MSDHNAFEQHFERQFPESSKALREIDEKIKAVQKDIEQQFPESSKALKEIDEKVKAVQSEVDQKVKAVQSEVDEKIKAVQEEVDAVIDNSHAAQAAFSISDSVNAVFDPDAPRVEKEAAAFTFASAVSTATVIATAASTAQYMGESVAAYAPTSVGKYFATPKPLLFYSAWFCPFAQRAHIALEAKHVAYKYVECALYHEASDGTASKVALSLEEKRRRNPEFVRASPLGLVPALFDQAHNARVHESHVCVLYVDEAFAGLPLLPTDPAARAHVRAAVTYFDDKVRPHFYALLMRPDKAGREQAAADFTAGWANLAHRMDGEGPYFCGAQFTIFECAALPWFQRIESVLGHYRGYGLPREQVGSKAYERLKMWYCACLENPAFARTICNRERLIANYSGYADNTAQNDVSATVRAPSTERQSSWSSWSIRGGSSGATPAASKQAASAKGFAHANAYARAEVAPEAQRQPQQPAAQAQGMPRLSGSQAQHNVQRRREKQQADEMRERIVAASAVAVAAASVVFLGVKK
jgi:glutathione S-transferase